MIFKTDEAVSDAIGVILLIAIATLAIGIIGVNLFSQVSVTNIPRADLSILWQTDPSGGSTIKPFIVFERGDSLFFESTEIKINDVRKNEDNNLKIKKYGSNVYVSWKDKKIDGKVVPFTIGDTIKWDDPDNQAQKISIVFQQAGKAILLSSGEKPSDY